MPCFPEIDITTADGLRGTAAEIRYPFVVVHMTRTSFRDSSGLHVLLAAHSQARSEGSDLRLVVPTAGAVGASSR